MMSANCFVRRLGVALSLAVVILLLMSAEMTSSAPTNRRRTRHLTVYYPTTYSYHVNRMGLCADDDRVFADCFLCGRLANEVRIYRGCCNRHRPVVRYCDHLLTWTFTVPFLPWSNPNLSKRHPSWSNNALPPAGTERWRVLEHGSRTCYTILNCVTATFLHMHLTSFYSFN